MKAYNRILRINGFEKFFDKHKHHIRNADSSDVKTALNLSSQDRSYNNIDRNPLRSKDEQMSLRGRIPNSIYFDKGLWKGVDLASMDEKEREDMWNGFWKVFTKLRSTH